MGTKSYSKAHPRMPIKERLLRARTLVRHGRWKCWEYTGRRNNHGYGVIRFDGDSHYCHRVAWELWIGPVPENLKVLHRCDNPACFKPDHLWVGTQKDNIQDAIKKRRMLIGELNGSSQKRRAQREHQRLASNGQAVLDVRVQDAAKR